MILMMMLWIVALTMMVLIVGLQMQTGVYSKEIMDGMKSLMWYVLIGKYSIMAFSYICYKRTDDRTNKTR